MKRTSLFLATIFFLAFASNSFAGEKGKESSSAAAVKISGKVIDVKTGEALAGVMVKIEDMNLTSYTDLDGNFEIQGLIPGKYDITTSLISYEPLKMNVEVTNSLSKLKVSLETLSKGK